MTAADPTTGAHGTAGSLARHWTTLVGATLLGTDRRPPPPPPPGAIAALVEPADPGRDQLDEATAVLVQVAALTALRRAGLRPLHAPPPLAGCPPDPRPVCAPSAARRLAELLEGWTVLVDEWLGALEASGFRLPPEHAVALLGRFRTDPVRRAQLLRVAGPVAAWITELFPEQLAPRRSAAPAVAGAAPAPTAPATGAAPAPTPPVTGAAPAPTAPAAELSPDLAPLLTGTPAELAATLVDGLDRGRWLPRHRALLVRLISHVERDALDHVADRLAADVLNPTAVALGADLADLARTRSAMLAELAPIGGGTTP